ncbi:MAG TPA: 2,3,4,5-tetrahydropyridine-2,6-dicarboxylate N-succinyltransferase [Alphaproteobacteria bacterium]|jgi:2,3,4,5-tetrahydropyridine-2-carboxylate N-succinyltransferase|nr:2,3,4,5-tetrahydropyridine-2,6-dicarboxylate N-succinyltransferase [Alphaproteobacteria bacterium]HIK87540.1 2,3,4,5-tetrahydropyridine-2,6-dicarboxylate N-succinyltransferase [Alphaproteobacteria bacterium]
MTNSTNTNLEDLKNTIEEIWNKKESISSSIDGIERNVIEECLGLLDSGEVRVSEKIGDKWKVNEWLKKAVLLSFRLWPMDIISGGPGNGNWWDKVPSKFSKWDSKDFQRNNFRTVPGSIVRYSAYISPEAILMPSFVNLGARIGSGTMIDTWSTVGSCAQVGNNCHISGGVGLGGVLEPLQATPVIIEDNCFIGARSEIAEGVIVEEGAVISMGVYIGASTKIIDRKTGKIFYGKVPAYSVVVPGSMKTSSYNDENNLSLYCAVIVKRVDAKTRSKTSINELLRD